MNYLAAGSAAGGRLRLAVGVLEQTISRKLEDADTPGMADSFMLERKRRQHAIARDDGGNEGNVF
ncbi:MAG: hypothetical protein TREMPRED_002983 [Tremellales sp. Tagirdzhanova-0007]|nr:MAG: hypothetical protein TREMPRED_002983 [Tremellales sp. Tagirdzhanova-0007]